MKNLFIKSLALILLVLSIFTLTSFNVTAAEKVVIYNWSDYIPESLLEEFTKETGIEVEVSTYDSNETMYAKLKLLDGKGYDLAVPTTFFVEKMIRTELLQPIDKSKLKNLANLDPRMMNKAYDLNNQYSIPYLWGSTAIAVNADEIDPSGIKRWSDLWDKKYKGQILLLDDVRDIFLMGLKVKGFENNTRSEKEIEQAYLALKDLMPNVKTFLSDSPKGPMIQGEVNIAVMWNGEAYMAAKEMDNVVYIYPEEGVTLWVDSFVIPKNAANVDNAHKFIDFVLRPTSSVKILTQMGFSTPNIASLPLLDEKMRNDTMIFPAESVIKNGSFHVDLDEANIIYENYWQKLKAGQ